MFESVETLHEELLNRDPRDFVSHHIFEPIPFAFGNQFEKWIDWKTRLAEGISVDPYDVVLTGSAAIGYSLNPKKNYKPFDATSDIDCGVISQYHFEVAWRYLRQLRPAWLSLPPESKRAITFHRTSYVFNGTIATDSILGLLPFGAEWQKALDSMATLDPTIGREVKLRIYRDYESLRHYQAMGIEKLRTALVADESESHIGVED